MFHPGVGSELRIRANADHERGAKAAAREESGKHQRAHEATRVGWEQPQRSGYGPPEPKATQLSRFQVNDRNGAPSRRMGGGRLPEPGHDAPCRKR